jgi:hypothetical protein
MVARFLLPERLIQDVGIRQNYTLPLGPQETNKGGMIARDYRADAHRTVGFDLDDQ